MKTSTPHKILVLGPAWVGDMVMAQTVFKVLKQANPAVIIDVMAPAWSQDLLDRMPEVNKTWVSPFGHGQLQLRKRWQMGRSLRHEDYEQAILLTNSWKSAIIPFAAGIPKRTGWLGEFRYGLLNDVRHLDKQKLPLMIQRFIALGLAPDAPMPTDPALPSLHTSATHVDTVLAKHGISRSDAPVLALCPGAEFGEAKRWPAEHFAAVAKARIAEGWQVWLFGGPKDQPIAATICKDLPPGSVDLTGKTSLADAVDLLSLADAAVCNDTGLMHIVAALGRPMVVVYGSSSPKFTPPLANNVKILSLGLDCSPCFQRTCPLEHKKCLNDLAPDQVLAGLMAL